MATVHRPHEREEFTLTDLEVAKQFHLPVPPDQVAFFLRQLSHNHGARRIMGPNRERLWDPGSIGSALKRHQRHCTNGFCRPELDNQREETINSSHGNRNVTLTDRWKKLLTRGDGFYGTVEDAAEILKCSVDQLRPIIHRTTSSGYTVAVEGGFDLSPTMKAKLAKRRPATRTGLREPSKGRRLLLPRLKQLIADAGGELIMENAVPRIAEQLGVDPDKIRTANRKLVEQGYQIARAANGHHVIGWRDPAHVHK